MAGGLIHGSSMTKTNVSGSCQFAVEEDGRDPRGKKFCRVDHKVIFGLLELASTWDRNLAAQRFDSVFVRQLRERSN
jgi:hypothetical protein